MTKRILAMVLAMAMVLCSMGTVVFAADEVTTIKTTDYTTFKDAMDVAYKTSGAVVVEITGKVEFTDGMELDNGTYDSITFIGADDDATIDIQQSSGGDYLTAHGKTIAFKNLKLAKTPAAWGNNSGHMGNYFSLQGGTATYENCTFLNGACTSGGTAKYNNCTFQNDTEYGLWVYDNALVTVNGGTIDSNKGIKVYAEDEQNVTSTLTVEKATFTENVIAKPAVAIAYADAITLIGNTYNNKTSVLELDSGSDADCNGITFVAEDADGKDITSTLTVVDRNNGNACGVFVTDANGNTAIYTTATEAAKEAEEGDTVTLLYNTEEDVTFGAGVVVDTNNYAAPNVGAVVASIERDGEVVYYTTLVDALKAVQAGETITLLSDITFTEKWDSRVINGSSSGGTINKAITFDGNKKTLKFTGEVSDKNANCIFDVKADTTFKNLTIDMSGVQNKVNDMRAIRSGDCNLTIENCTFIGNGVARYGVIYNEAVGNSDNVIKVTGSDFINWSSRGLSDNRNDMDVAEVCVDDCTFENAPAYIGASDKITFTNNTMTNSATTMRSYTSATTGKALAVVATGNTLDADKANEIVVSGTATVKADKGFDIVAEAILDGVYYDTFDNAVAAAKGGDTVKLTNGTNYKVPEIAPEGKVVIIFDFNGGINAAKYINSTAVYSLGDSVTAPTGIKKDGFIFAGWDKAVQETAYAPATYTAQWVSMDDYKFETVLTPVGGTPVADNEIKIDPQGSFIVEVSIQDTKTDMAWNVTEVTLSYNPKLFTWNKLDNTVEETKAGELKFKVYGADKVEGKVAKQLSFTTLPNSNTTSTFEGVFNVTKATVDTGWAANTINATLVDADKNGTAKVYIYYTFDVTVGDGVEAPSTADTITDYEGKIKDYDDDYNYDIIIDMEGNDDLDVDYDDATGEFVIPNEEIVGDFTIDAVVTGIKGISVDDVEVHEYVAGKYALVLVNAAKAKKYTYNGANMFVASHYDKYSGLKQTYAYLVKDGGFEYDEKNDTLNTPANKTLALSKIKLGTEKNLAIAGIAKIGDVNGTGVLDVNDIQAAWNAYNAGSNDAPKVNENMDFYFRADVNRDKVVDMKDCNVVVGMYDGNETVTAAVLATCDKEGNTLGVTVGETVLVESVTVPARGHDYEWQGFTGKELNIKSTEVCTLCGGTRVTPVTDVIENASIAYGGNIEGTVNVESAEDLIYINRLSKAGTGNSGLLIGMEDELTINIKNDIDLAGYKWFPMYAARFVINGNGKTIKNLDAEQGYSGKSGFLSFGGGSTIKDLTLENVTAKGAQAGAFAGLIEGATIENCKIKGDINITWEQNTFRPNYTETWNGVAAVVGIVSSGSIDVTDEGATLNIITDGMTSDGKAAPDDIVKYVYNQTGNNYSKITITKK